MFKAFVTFLYACVLASVVLAEDLAIASPLAGDELQAGSYTPVRLVVQTWDSSYEDVPETEVTIGILGCGTSECAGAEEAIAHGRILYSGPYDPQSHDDGYGQYQDLYVRIPELLVGAAQLGVQYQAKGYGPQYTGTTIVVTN